MPKGDKEILKADPEDGTTPVSNLLLEALAYSQLSGLERGALAYLWRRTYGWTIGKGKRRKERVIPLSEWAKALRTDRITAWKTLNSLEEKCVIKLERLGKGKSISYMTNTHIYEWACIDKELFTKWLTPVSQINNTGVSETANTVLAKPTTPLDTKSALPKETNKEMVNKTILKNNSQLPDKKVDPLNELRAKVITLLEEKRGYKSPKPGAEAKAITWMLKQSYSVEDIMNTYQVMSEKPFWKDKELFMASVQGQIGKIMKGAGDGQLLKVSAAGLKIAGEDDDDE
ncbi:replication protein [Chloroflexota bacterium]